MRPTWIAGLFAVVLVLGFEALPARAQGGTAADCTIVVSVQFSPGVGLTPVSGMQTSGGETGTITCAGVFDGHRVGGAGTFGYDGVFTGINCISDTAPLSGTYHSTVPTDAGPLEFTGTITDSRIGVLDRFQLSQPGARMDATAVIVPTAGDCVLTPVTRILIVMTGSFRG